MATNLGELYFQLGARTQGLKKAQIETNKFAQNTNKNFTNIKALAGKAALALAAVVTLKTIGRVVQLADEYHVLQQRLKTATKATGAYVKVSKEIYKISNDNGTALATNVALFQSLARVAPEIGASTKQILKLTKTVGQLGVIGGSSTEQMKNGLLQFTQGLAAGVLRAEEMNSILENIPEVASRMAKGMGMTVGGLRKAVIAGKVLSQDVFDSLIKQAPEIAREFEDIPLTMDRGMQTLRNGFQKFVAEWDKILGISTAVANITDAIGRALGSEALTNTKNIEKRFELMKEVGKEFIGIFTDAFPDGEAEKFFSKLGKGIKDAWRGVTSFFDTIGRLPLEFARLALQGFRKIQGYSREFLLPPIRKAFLDAYNFIKDIFIKIANFVKDTPFLNALFEGMVTFAESFSGIISAIFTTVSTWGKTGKWHVNNIVIAAQLAWEKIKLSGAIAVSSLHVVWAKLGDFIDNMFGKILGWVLDGMSNIPFIGDKLDGLKEFAENLKSLDNEGKALVSMEGMIAPIRERIALLTEEKEATEELINIANMRSTDSDRASSSGASYAAFYQEQANLREADQKRREEEEKIREQERIRRLNEEKEALGSTLETLTDSLSTEIEIEKRAYAESLANLQRAEELELETILPYHELRERLEKQHLEKLNELQNSGSDGGRRDAAQAALQSLTESLSTQKEIEMRSYAEALENLRIAEELKIETIIPYHELRERLETQHQENLNNIVGEYSKDRTKIEALGAFMGTDLTKKAGDLTLKEQGSLFKQQIDQAAEHSKTFFEIKKAMALATALIEAPKAVLSAYTFGAELGGPILGGVFAGIAAAATAVQIGAIASSQFKGGRASGGPVSPGSLYRVNEKGPEMLSIGSSDFLMMGSKSGSITSNEKLKNNEGNVYINVYPQSGETATVQSRDSQGGKEINIFIEKLKSDMANDIRRGGSDISNALETQYGLNRVAGGLV